MSTCFVRAGGGSALSFLAKANVVKSDQKEWDFGKSLILWAHKWKILGGKEEHSSQGLLEASYQEFAFTCECVGRRGGIYSRPLQDAWPQCLE